MTNDKIVVKLPIDCLQIRDWLISIQKPVLKILLIVSHFTIIEHIVVATYTVHTK